MDSSVLIGWSSSCLLAVSLVWLYWLLAEEGTENSSSSKASLIKLRRNQGIFLRVFGGLVIYLGRLIAQLPIKAHRENLSMRLVKAGRPGQLTADEFDACRIIASAMGFLCGSYIDFEISLSPVVTIGLLLLGFLYPDIWLKGLIQKRQRSIFRSLPDTLDILRLAVDAGLDLGSALKVVVERGRKSPLLDELENVEREMALGRSRKEALKNFADNIGMSEINSFVLALIQADQLGASIGPVLRTQSEMARARRWHLAEALVNKMPMKMLGPLVLFIFPSSFIILFTPLVIQWMQAK